MANRRDIQFFYTSHNKSSLLDCSFTVDATAGAGISGLEASGRIASVYMHSSSPSSANPNPLSGYIVVNLMDNYNRYLGAWASFQAPVTGSAIAFSAGSGVSAGDVVQIVSLGTTTTAANFVSAGVSNKISPAVGVSFVATAALAAGTGLGDATFKQIGNSGIDSVELLGNAELMNAKLAAGGPGGMQLIFGCYAGGSLTAPAAGSIISLEMYFNNSAEGV